ncbi:hypothetical protein [Williamsia sterculiae]|uniref:Uncharacterized protein n=1 Tax=Williamsia sterculiae TaxID=1344003 RepID=A0A1N7FVN4_9NOCA|nr:hypothetical protein [Williamsia sterculiae]SIS04347.1 hypothetical protein SAMN05445060_2326 [Williamsia sterculiae]
MSTPPNDPDGTPTQTPSTAATQRIELGRTGRGGAHREPATSEAAPPDSGPLDTAIESAGAPAGTTSPTTGPNLVQESHPEKTSLWHRIPRTLFRGRVRTTTAVMLLAFVGCFLLYGQTSAHYQEVDRDRQAAEIQRSANLLTPTSKTPTSTPRYTSTLPSTPESSTSESSTDETTPTTTPDETSQQTDVPTTTAPTTTRNQNPLAPFLNQGTTTPTTQQRR